MCATARPVLAQRVDTTRVTLSSLPGRPRQGVERRNSHECPRYVLCAAVSALPPCVRTQYRFALNPVNPCQEPHDRLIYSRLSFRIWPPLDVFSHLEHCQLSLMGSDAQKVPPRPDTNVRGIPRPVEVSPAPRQDTQLPSEYSTRQLDMCLGLRPTLPPVRPRVRGEPPH